MRIAFACLTLLTAAVSAVPAVAAEGAASSAGIADMRRDTDPRAFYEDLKPGAVAQEERMYLQQTQVVFVTKRTYGSTRPADGADGGTRGAAVLTGVDNATFQAIADETEAYFREAMGARFALLSYADLQGTPKFHKIQVRKTPAQLGVDEEIDEKPEGTQGPVTVRAFVADGRPLLSTGSEDMKSGMALWEACKTLKAARGDLVLRVDFASLAVGAPSAGASSAPSLEPNIHPCAGSFTFAAQSMNTGSLALKKNGSIPDASWAKEIREVEGGWEVVADPEKYKAAALRTLKAHIDMMAALMREARS